MAKVIMLCGKLCSGKSSYANALLADSDAVILSVDELMTCLLGKETGEMHDEYVRRSIQYLYRKTADIAHAGADVILDNGLWKREERSYAKEYFASRGIDCEIHYLHISNTEWEYRISCRNANVKAGKCNDYYVDDGLRRKFLSLFEEPTADEGCIIIEG